MTGVVGAGRRGAVVGETWGLVSAPSRPTPARRQNRGETGGTNRFGERQRYYPPERRARRAGQTVLVNGKGITHREEGRDGRDKPFW
ncbi:MAG: hypothetical protein HS099_24950 [Ardenticatenaceae bacterium]|nr:hypothetical protein [Ardenticatenaceae bacterium]